MDEFIKKTLFFRGNLTLNLQKEYNEVNKNGSNYLVIEHIGSFPIAFELTNGDLFFNQFFGSWSGVYFDYTTELMAKDLMKNISLNSLDNTYFKIVPNRSSLKFNGETYYYISQKISKKELQKYEVPYIELEFVSNTG